MPHIAENTEKFLQKKVHKIKSSKLSRATHCCDMSWTKTRLCDRSFTVPVFGCGTRCQLRCVFGQYTLWRLLKAYRSTETVAYSEFLFIGAAYKFSNSLTY